MSNLNTKIDNFDGSDYKELIIYDMNLKIDRFNTESVFNLNRGFFQKDENSLFSFFELREDQEPYENKGFNLIMAKSEFSFRGNIFLWKILLKLMRIKKYH